MAACRSSGDFVSSAVLLGQERRRRPTPSWGGRAILERRARPDGTAIAVGRPSRRYCGALTEGAMLVTPCRGIRYQRDARFLAISLARTPSTVWFSGWAAAAAQAESLDPRWATMGISPCPGPVSHGRRLQQPVRIEDSQSPPPYIGHISTPSGTCGTGSRCSDLGDETIRDREAVFNFIQPFDNPKFGAVRRTEANVRDQCAVSARSAIAGSFDGP